MNSEGGVWIPCPLQVTVVHGGPTWFYPKPEMAGKWSLQKSLQIQSKARAMAGKQTKAGAGCDWERHQRGRSEGKLHKIEQFRNKLARGP